MIPELSNRIQGMDGGVSNFRISEEEEGAVSYNIYIYIYIQGLHLFKAYGGWHWTNEAGGVDVGYFSFII